MRTLETVCLTLASSSPRRKELLSQLGWEFRVVAPEIDECVINSEIAEDYVRRVSIEKAEKVFQGLVCEAARNSDLNLVLASDTAVVLDKEILGKPSDALIAKEMLRRLSGRPHQVLTGIALVLEMDRDLSLAESGVDSSSLDFFAECKALGGHLFSVSSVISTEVVFKALTDDEIDSYCATTEPLDKAGAYGIQGRAGAFVKAISGSYSSVVGLPLFETNELLKLSDAMFNRRNERCVEQE